MRGAMPREARAVLPQPALERSSAHSVDVLIAALAHSSCQSTEQLVERLDDLAERFDDTRLYDRCDPLRRCRLVRQVMERVEDVRPGLVFGLALRDRRREFGDL